MHFYAVVPGYYLVCYNKVLYAYDTDRAVVPGYYLVCYNRLREDNALWLL